MVSRIEDLAGFLKEICFILEVKLIANTIWLILVSLSYLFPHAARSTGIGRVRVSERGVGIAVVFQEVALASRRG